MFDIDGFLTSTSFFAQLAAIITTVLTTLFGGLLSGFLGAGF